MRVGYYVHHHGRGHATRAGVIGAELLRRGHEVTYLGSGSLPDTTAGGSTVALTHDAADADAPFVDADAGGRLHWAPLGGGYAHRSAQIAAWVAQARPDIVVVDVSVEVTALMRLLGVPVVVVGQPGRRDDAPHALAFDLAAAVLAPWPEDLDVAPHLARVGERVATVGGITRFAATVSGDGGAHGLVGHAATDEPRCAWGEAVRTGPKTREGEALSEIVQPVQEGAEDEARRGVMLVGGEGWDDAGLPDAVRRAVPEVAWASPDSDHPVESLLAAADVVVTHAGQNALADVAAFGVPAVVIPQDRPFGEQADMARALDAAGIARGLWLGASALEIATEVRSVLAGDDGRSTGAAWARWNVLGAAARAAEVIENAGCDVSTQKPSSRRSPRSDHRQGGEGSATHE